MTDQSEFYRALGETQRSIAEVGKSVAALQVHMTMAVAGLADLKETLAEDRERSRLSRAHISDSISEIEKRLAHVEEGVLGLASTKATVDRMEQTVSEMEDAVAKIERRRLGREATIAGGAAGLTGIIAAAVWARDTIASALRSFGGS